VVLRGDSVKVIRLIITSNLLSLNVNIIYVKAAIESIALTNITYIDVIIEVIVDLLLITNLV
jgi:hypothetical protein